MLFGQEHVERYRATDGEEGYDWQRGTTILLLTTRGRTSGEERTTPLIFRPHGDGWSPRRAAAPSRRPGT